MFDFFRRRTAKELIEQANETYGLPEPVKVPTMPETKKKINQEYYRVGYNSVDHVTRLIIKKDNGFSMTLSLNKSACEQMIRMIRATYDDGTESAS